MAALDQMASRQQEHSPPGMPLGLTAEGLQLYGPSRICKNCGAETNVPGALLTCVRCGCTCHADCLDIKPQAEAQIADWVCNACEKCDACGARCPSELYGHWSRDAASELLGGWRIDSGRRLLCIACTGALSGAARCAASLLRWAPGQLGMQCSTCSLWVGAEDGTDEGVGKPMPPPPPASVGGTALLPGRARLERCGRCEGESIFWRLKDALDELQAFSKK